MSVLAPLAMAMGVWGARSAPPVSSERAIHSRASDMGGSANARGGVYPGPHPPELTSEARDSLPSERTTPGLLGFTPQHARRERAAAAALRAPPARTPRGPRT